MPPIHASSTFDEDLPDFVNNRALCPRYWPAAHLCESDPDIENHARLAAGIGIPVATGEIEAGRWRFKEILVQRAAMILQADAAVCGGISEWRRIAHTADTYGVMVSPHWFHDLHIYLVAATPNGRYVEFFPDDQVLNFRRLIDRQLETKNGDLLLPQGPGLGFKFDEDAVARH